MSDALVVVNMNRKIEIVNPSLLLMLGYSQGELIGEGIDTITGTVTNNNKRLTELLKTGVITDVETTFRKKMERCFPYLSRGPSYATASANFAGSSLSGAT